MPKIGTWTLKIWRMFHEIDSSQIFVGCLFWQTFWCNFSANQHWHLRFQGVDFQRKLFQKCLQNGAKNRHLNPQNLTNVSRNLIKQGFRWVTFLMNLLMQCLRKSALASAISGCRFLALGKPWGGSWVALGEATEEAPGEVNLLSDRWPVVHLFAVRTVTGRSPPGEAPNRRYYREMQ